MLVLGDTEGLSDTMVALGEPEGFVEATSSTADGEVDGVADARSVGAPLKVGPDDGTTDEDGCKETVG